MPTRNGNLTDELEHFVQARVESGHYQKGSEVIRAALRSLDREEKQNEVKLAMLRRAIDEGDTSGVASGDVFGRIRKTLNLPVE